MVKHIFLLKQNVSSVPHEPSVRNDGCDWFCKITASTEYAYIIKLRLNHNYHYDKNSLFPHKLLLFSVNQRITKHIHHYNSLLQSVSRNVAF